MRALWQTLFIVAFTCVSTLSAQAKGLLRDPDIEYALGRLAQPIFEAAGLPNSRMRIVIVDDRSPNAFVMDNSHVFIHYGLILKLESAEELQAVIAHEAAHITSGHLTQRYAAYQNASRATVLGMILSGAAVLGGAGEAAGGVAVGVAGSAQRNMLAHSRAHEASADQAAVRYLASAGVDPAAMIKVLNYFAGQEVLSAARQDPYVRSHPLSRDRIRALEGYVAAANVRGAADKDAQYWYARARGKLEAFVLPPARTLRAVSKNDTSDVAVMRRAVALHRQPKPKEAIAAINALIAARPNDPYYAELQGQILLENRQFAAAVQAYRRAANLAPSNGLIQAGLGKALLATGDKSQLNAAIKALESARAREPYGTSLLRQLASAYAQNGQPGMATLNAAEAHLLRGEFASAKSQAERAQAQLSYGSPAWNRALDVIRSAEAAL